MGTIPKTVRAAIVAAAMTAASAALTSAPALAASSAPAKPAAAARTAAPAALPSCDYRGPIKSARGFYLTPFYYGSQGDYQGEAAATNPSKGESWCVQQAKEGGYYFLPVSGNGALCLDGQDQNVGTVVRLWNCNGTETQRWCWDGAGFVQRPAERSVSLRDNITSPKKTTVVTLATTANSTRFYIQASVIEPSCGN
jgi:hypothetical protein